MKKAKLIVLSLILFVGAFFVSACRQEPPVLATAIYVSESSVEITLGEFATIDVEIAPEKATSKDFEVVMLTNDVVTIDYDKANMQFTINAPNTIPNGFDTIELEVRTLDGSEVNTHLSVKLKERITPVSDPKNLHYNNGLLVWSEVMGAQGYIVNINGEDMPMVHSNNFVVDDSLIGQQVVARVYAVGEDDSLSSGYSEYTFKILSVPQNLAYANGTITWDEVESATGYYVWFDGKVEFVAYNQLYVLDRFSEPKTYPIKVMAVGDVDNNIENSAYTTEISVEKLTTPQNLRIANGILLWDAILNKTSYKVYLDSEEPIFTSKTSLTLPSDLSAGSHFVTLQTIGDEINYLTSDISVRLDFEKLQPVVRLYIENGEIHWDANLRATSYMLYVNGVAYQTTNIDVNCVDFADYNSGTYSLNVKAIGNGGNILDSDLMQSSVEATKLATPINLTMQTIEGNNYLVWDEIEGASAYNLIINGAEPFVISENKYLLDVEAGTYTAKVQALGDNQQYINSNYSVMFTTTKLEDAKNLTVSGGVVVWDKVVGVGKYQVLIDNQTIVETTNNKFDFISNDQVTYQAKQYEISVRALPSESTNIKSDYCSSIMVTKLPVPTIKVQFGQLVNVIVANGTVTYKVSLLSKDGAVISSYSKNTVSDISSETYQKFSITAQTFADNQEGAQTLYVNSDVSSAFECIQLPKVTDITITNGILTFGNTTYQDITEGFTFNLQVTDNTQNSTTDISRLPAQKEFDFSNYQASDYSYSIQAIANYNTNGEALTQVPYLTSKMSAVKTFKVLGTPANAKISSLADVATSIADLMTAINDVIANPSGILVWDKVEGATKYSVKIDNIEKLITTSNKCNLIGLLTEDDNVHKITIQAIGNGTDVISGVYGNEIECKKLERPTNLQCDGSSISWYSKYSNFTNIMQLMSEDVNIVIFVAVINGSEYITLNYDGLDMFNLADKLSSKTYELPELKAGEYVTNIYAIPLNVYVSGLNIAETTGVHYVLSEYNTNDLHIMSLMAPQALTMQNKNNQQVLSWSPLLYENGEVAEYVVEIEYDNLIESHSVSFDQTSFVFENYVPGTYFFNVYAKATSGAYFEKNGKKYYYIDSTYSNTVKSIVMENPELFVKNGDVNWTEVEGVEHYILTFGKSGQTQQTLEFNKNKNSFNLGSEFDAGQYTFKIMAVGNGSAYITSEYSDIQTYTKLAEITNVRLENGVIKYDSNPVVALDSNDCYYSVVVNNVSFANEKLVSTELEGYRSGNYTIVVYAFGDDSIYLTSNISNQITCIKLAAPTEVEIDNGLLKWTKANNASGYQLNISGSIVSDILGVTYQFEDLESGDYLIKVKAIGNSTSYLNSDWTGEHTISKLEEIKNLRVENGVIVWDVLSGSKNNIRLKIKSINAEDYTEIQLDPTTSTYSLDHTYKAGQYQVCMYNAGGISAISSTETDVISVVKLDKPTNLRISTEESEQFIVFDQTGNAGGYILKIVYNSGANNITKQIELTTTKLATSDLQNYGVSIESSGTYNLSVMAVGRNTPYVHSNFSEVLTITKPEAPVLIDVKTSSGASSGKVKWDTVEHADFYRVVIEKEGGETSEFETTKTYIYLSNSTKYTISVTACKSMDGFDSETSTIEVTYALYEGSGTEADPYRIKTAADFNNIQYNPIAHYKLVSDIEFGSTALGVIATDQEPFQGVIDGSNYKISGVSVSSYNEKIALVNVLGENGTIKNTELDISISSGQIVGGVVAINYGTVLNCVVTGSVSPIYNISTATLKAGGIVGINHGNISMCLNKANVAPQNTLNITYAGGIAAENYGIISGCGNNAYIASTYAGGISAYSKGNISYCYNSETAEIVATSYSSGITCSGYAGGIVGYADGAENVVISTCYNVGKVLATSAYNTVIPYAGGIVGYNNGYEITNCYSSNTDETNNLNISTIINNSELHFAGVLVGCNAKGSILNNVSICQSTSQVDAYKPDRNPLFANTRIEYSALENGTIANNLSGYESTDGKYPKISENKAKY